MSIDATDRSASVADGPQGTSDSPGTPPGEAVAQLKTDFLSSMSHEIRTPMNAILGFAEILADELPPGEHREHALSVVQASHSLLRIMNTILDYTRIEAGSLTLYPVGFSPETLAREILREFQAPAREKGLQLFLQLHDNVPAKIFLDEMRLREILLHLMDNAIKFTPAGSVRMTVFPGGSPEKEGNSLVFEITDTGPGLSSALAARIFECGEDAGSLSRDLIGHTGLGLAFCQKLAGLLGGRLSFRPSATGVGSTLALVLHQVPCLDDSMTDASGYWDRRPEAQGGDLAALVVDDVETNRDLLQAYLTSMGVRVTTACDGIAALEVLASEPIDLVLTDLKMPRLDGRELAQAIHRHTASVQPGHAPIPEVVLVTADPDVRQSPPSEFAAILEKPLRKSCLREVLERLFPASRQTLYWGDLPEPPLPAPSVLSPNLREKALHLRQTLRVRGVRQLAEEILREAREAKDIRTEKYAGELLEAADALRIPRLQRLLAMIP